MIDEPDASGPCPPATADHEPSVGQNVVQNIEPYIEIDDGDTRWRFEPGFLRSRWTCIWGRGCQGILDHPAEHLGQGCCSIGAEIDGPDEARNIAALAATLAPAQFEHHADAAAGPTALFADVEMTNTRVVDGACIFLNRPGFAGGAGCALHLAAVAHGESPIDWKPSVCWQLPIHVDWDEPDAAAHPASVVEVATVRRWSRADWGPDGDTMAWCCTEEPDAYVGDRPVIDTLSDELVAIVGEPVVVELRRRLTR